MTQDQKCSVPGCARAPAATLETRFYCREHFIGVSYEQLDGAAQWLQENGYSDLASESVRRFLEECMPQAAGIAQRAEDLDNLARARLLDILLWAADLGARLRRSPRRPLGILIRVRSDRPGRPWKEETRTQLVSRHGAMFECTQPVEKGEMLEVCRLDTGQRALARVVWVRNKGSGRLDAGVEFTTPVNFWDLESQPAGSEKKS